VAESWTKLTKLEMTGAEHPHCMAPYRSCFTATQMAESCNAVFVSLDSEAECMTTSKKRQC